MDNLAADFEINPNNPLNAEYELNEGINFDCSFELFAAGTVWGSITGNIENQTDLINILNEKVDSTTFEELSQTVSDNYNELSEDISDLTGTVTDNYNTLSGQISDLSDTVDNNYSALDNRLTTAEQGILDLTETVTDNYTELNNKITVNSGNITTLTNTINSYGDIVTYDAADFATKNQGELADTALQPNDNITLLNNNAGYITSADLPTLEDLTTQTQRDAINSGANTTNIGQITTNKNDITAINNLIPNQATASNQLADKNFVNSSIATNTAYFIGTFNSVAELEAYSGTLTNNDYAFVATTDSAGNTLYDRYKYNADTQEWIFEYELNNSSFTAQQWASINSGITSGDVSLINSALQPNDNISELTNDVGYITAASLPTVNNGTLTINRNNTPVGSFSANSATNTTVNITVPTDTSDLTNNAGFITNSALTPYALSADLAEVATSGDYDDLINKPTIPTVNDGTLTIQANSQTIGTFTANQSGDTTVDITIPDSATWGNITGDIADQTDLQTVLNAKQNILTSANAGTDIEITEPVVEYTEAGNGSVTFTTVDNAVLTSVQLTGGTAQNTIPKGYKRVASLTTDGVAYLETPYNAYSVDRVQGTVSFTQLVTGSGLQYVVGGRTGSSSSGAAVGYCVYAPSHGGLTYYPISWKDDSVGMSVTTGVDYVFDTTIVAQGTIKLIINDSVRQDATMTNTKGSSAGTNKICLFSLTNGSYNQEGTTLKNELIFYGTDGEILAYYIFVERESDNALGALNLLDGSFITNSAGTFTKGAYVTDTTYPVQVVPTPTNSVDITCNNGVIELNPNMFSYDDLNWSTSTTIVYNPIYVGDGTFTLSTPDLLSYGSNITNMWFIAGNVSSGANSTTNGVYKGRVMTQTAINGYVTIAMRAQGEGSAPADRNPRDYTWYLRRSDYTVTGTVETVTDSLSNTATAENLFALTDTYKDTQAILTGSINRNCKIIVLDGSENWSAANNSCYLAIGISGVSFEGLTAYCTHFAYDNTKHSTSTIANNTFIFNQSVGQTGTNGSVTIKATDLFTTAATVKAWLAEQYANGTPVIMVVPIPTEVTETVTAQSLNIQEGSNTFTITQASLPALPLAVSYKEGSDNVVISFTNDTGYITGIDNTDVTDALGYTPVNPSSLATVATSGRYNDLIDTPTIPTVNDGTITINQGGVEKGTFTLNQSGNTIINLDAGGTSSVTWGNVTGTLSDQTDLQDALDAKVNKSGDTMTGILNINRTTGSNFVHMQSGQITRGTTPSSIITLGFMELADANNQWLGKNQMQFTTSGEYKMELSTRNASNDSTSKLSVGWDANNIAFATAPATSTSRNNSTDIITRGYLNTQLGTKQDTISDLSTIRSNAALGATALQSITSSDVTTALGYTPVDKAGDTMSGQLISEVELATVQNPYIIKYSDVDFSTSPNSTWFGGIEIRDGNNNRMGRVEYSQDTSGEHHIALVDKKSDTEASYSVIKTGWDANGNAYCNFPNTTCVDGQWVSSYRSVASSVSLPVGTSQTLGSYSLASYLPDDGYIYEVAVYMSVVTGATNGSYVHAWAYGQNGVILVGAGGSTRAAATMSYNTRGTAIIGANRNLSVTYTAQTSAGTLSALQVLGYRRIGTNA